MLHTAKICMYTNCLQDNVKTLPNVFFFLSLNLGPKSLVQHWQTPSSQTRLLWTLAATSIPDISLSVIAIDKREGNQKTVTKGLLHAATMLTSYALYSLFTCTWHYARSIHRFPPFMILDYQSNRLPDLWVSLWGFVQHKDSSFFLYCGLA